MQDTDDSDAAPRDMFLNKVKRNKGIAAPFSTRAAGRGPPARRRKPF